MTHLALCREGCYSVGVPAYQDILRSDAATIAEYSRAAGYCTLTSGKRRAHPRFKPVR